MFGAGGGAPLPLPPAHRREGEPLHHAGVHPGGSGLQRRDGQVWVPLRLPRHEVLGPLQTGSTQVHFLTSQFWPEWNWMQCVSSLTDLVSLYFINWLICQCFRLVPQGDKKSTACYNTQGAAGSDKLDLPLFFFMIYTLVQGCGSGSGSAFIFLPGSGFTLNMRIRIQEENFQEITEKMRGK